MNYADPYHVLGIDKTASQVEIRKAYRDLAKKYHPDINAEAGAAAMTAKINAAYDLLIDPDKRSAYDNRYAFVSDESAVDFAEEDSVQKYYETFKNKNIAEARKKERNRAKREAVIYRVVRMVCYPIAFLSLLVILDYFLPVYTELDYPLYGYQSPNGKFSEVSSFMKTTQHEFEVPNSVHVDYDYDAVEKKLLCMEFTPIFNTIKRVGVDHGEYALMYEAQGTIYLPWLLPVPYLLLLASAYFIGKKEYTHLRYSICIIPLAIALAFFFVMILS